MYIQPNRDKLFKSTDFLVRNNIICDKSKTGLQSGLESRLQSGLESTLQTAPKSALKILEHIHINPQYTLTELAKQTGYSRSWIAETMKRLQEQGIIKRVGSDKTGHWEIIV